MSRGQARRNRDERGLVLPTRLMVLSISAVALAGLAFVATQPGDRPDTASPAAATQPKPAPSAVPTTVPVAPQTTAPKPKPEVRRAKYVVVVFNNSNVKGLAGQTATRAQRKGWTVIGTDNWYGTVDASTVYYPDRLKAAGSLLARDLGISRVKPAIAPMRPDRLTVILTGDYH
jgi:hypothetical protein